MQRVVSADDGLSVRTNIKAAARYKEPKPRQALLDKLGSLITPSDAVGPQARQAPRKQSLSTWRLSKYPTDYFVGIRIETSAMAEQNTLRLP